MSTVSIFSSSILPWLEQLVLLFYLNWTSLLRIRKCYIILLYLFIFSLPNHGTWGYINMFVVIKYRFCAFCTKWPTSKKANRNWLQRIKMPSWDNDEKDMQVMYLLWILIIDLLFSNSLLLQTRAGHVGLSLTYPVGFKGRQLLLTGRNATSQ